MLLGARPRSSNKPELVVVVESMQGDDDMRALFREEVKPARKIRRGRSTNQKSERDLIDGAPILPCMASGDDARELIQE